MDKDSSALGAGWGKFLSQPYLQAILETLTNQQRLERRLTFLARTPITPVNNDRELIGDFIGEILAADLITDDQEAIVNDVGKFESYQNNITNIKHGLLFGQKQLNQLNEYKSQGGEGARFAAQWLTRRQGDLLLGIRSRLEALIVSAYLDNTIYDRYGVLISGTWGTPSDLKYVPPAPWNEKADATPIADLQFMINEVGEDLGALYVDDTVVTMSRKAFGHMVNSDEFQKRAKITPSSDFVFNFNVDGALPNPNDRRIQGLAEAICQCKFEFYETKITEKRDDGSIGKKRNLPHNNIILSGPSVWNNRQVLDLGSGILTESLVNELVGSNVVGGLPNNARGPLTWAAPTTANLNPPGITMWGAMRAFPRKFDKNATGMLDIGINPETGA